MMYSQEEYYLIIIQLPYPNEPNSFLIDASLIDDYTLQKMVDQCGEYPAWMYEDVDSDCEEQDYNIEKQFLTDIIKIKHGEHITQKIVKTFFYGVG